MNKQGKGGREVYIYIYILSMQHRRWLGMEGGEYIINAFTFSHSSNQNCESCWVTLYNNRDIIPRASDLSYLSFLSLSLSLSISTSIHSSLLLTQSHPSRFRCIYLFFYTSSLPLFQLSFFHFIVFVLLLFSEFSLSRRV